MNPWVIEPSDGNWHKVVILVATLALLVLCVSGPSGQWPRTWDFVDLEFLGVD